MSDEYNLPETLVERLAPVAREKYLGNMGGYRITRWDSLSNGVKDTWRCVVRELLAELEIAGLLKEG